MARGGPDTATHLSRRQASTSSRSTYVHERCSLAWDLSGAAPVSPACDVQMNEEFDAFARTCEIQIATEPVGIAPRDMTLTLDESELYHLVTLTRPGSSASVQVVFAKPATDDAPPAVSEVLWWLAGDAHLMEGAQGERGLWATAYGLPPEAEGTGRLFDQQRGQCGALRDLLGDVGYRRVLSIYESEMAGSR